jgi:uncharacterized membrane protein
MASALAGWGEMSAALAAFFASHILPARPAVRRLLHARLGAGAYAALYSLVSVALLGWLIVAARKAPHVQLWDFEPWQLWAPNLVMPIVCLLVAFGLAAPNPFSIAGSGGARFDPARPGVAAATRHPLLLAITLWALAHMIPNGDLAHVILFGLFAFFGVAGMAALDARARREWGEAVWAERAAKTSLVPFSAVAAGRLRLGEFRPSPWRAGAALSLYLTLLAAHPLVIGVSPLPQ